MKNILNEKPSTELTGLPLANVGSMDNDDIRNKMILDIGCGYGWFEMHAVKKGANKIVGIEISEQDLVTARNNISDSKISFQVGNAIDLPFENESFHTVVAWEVLEHLPLGKEGMMFAEVHRVLKAGGAFYMSTPESSFFSNTLDPAWWLIGHRHYSKVELLQFAANNGFQVEQIRSHGKYWTIISFVNLYVSKWIFRRRPFYENYINKKIEVENNQNDGFADIFMKCRKV